MLWQTIVYTSGNDQDRSVGEKAKGVTEGDFGKAEVKSCRQCVLTNRATIHRKG